ncbi:MAG: 6-carboxytetrahydropterin synthase, partial [Bdellovibrionaceae bacterium]|nr:6-carboxytetrahydropterin synthase [Pseudobdellovibrionaceae bacterium]
HGHNYRLQVLVPQTVDPLLLKSCLKKIKSEWDHENLNHLPELQNQIPTTESLVEILVKRLQEELKTTDVILRLYETEDLWVEWRSHG